LGWQVSVGSGKERFECGHQSRVIKNDGQIWKGCDVMDVAILAQY